MARDLPKSLSNRVARAFPLETLCEELVCLVVAHVEDLTDLCNMSLVSRRLYLLTVPILYRHVTLHAFRKSDVELLKQLSHPRTRMPQYIRTLHFPEQQIDLIKNHVEHYKRMLTSLLKVKNLRVFKWEAHEDIPSEILDTIATRFPCASIELHCFYGVYGGMTPVSTRPYSIFAHATRSQVTRFEFTTTDMSPFYRNFKEDVTNMIKNDKCLIYFKIKSSNPATFVYPEYLGSFRGHDLPQLTHFILDIPGEAIFTHNELSLWGTKGGWDRLNVLELKSMELFRAITNRAQNLSELKLSVNDYADSENNAALNVKEAVETKASFPTLVKFRFQDLTPLLPQSRHAVPLELLEQMPNLTSLNISTEDLPFDTEMCVDAPSLEEVKEIRRLCPKLEEFGIDMNQLGPFATWPRSILDELARFQQPIHLKLYLHQMETKRARLMKGKLDYYAISCHIRRERQRLGLPIISPFRVTYKIADELGRFDNEFNDPACWAINYETCLGAFTMTWSYGHSIQREMRDWHNHIRGRIIMTRRRVTKTRLGNWGTLKAKRVAEKLGWVSDDDAKDELTDPAVLADFPTLYDAWTQ